MQLFRLRIRTILRPKKIWHGNNVVIDRQDLSYIKKMVIGPSTLHIQHCASWVSRLSRLLFVKVESIVCVDLKSTKSIESAKNWCDRSLSTTRSISGSSHHLHKVVNSKEPSYLADIIRPMFSHVACIRAREIYCTRTGSTSSCILPVITCSLEQSTSTRYFWSLKFSNF